jgi:leucyl-tRNA synthetase
LFILFAAPPEKDLDWSDEGIEGAYRFLNRVWRLVANNIQMINKTPDLDYSKIDSNLDKRSKELLIKINLTVKKVTEDIDRDFSFNTAIASLMELTNSLQSFNPSNEVERIIFKEGIIKLIRLLHVFTPHITEELWEMLGNTQLLATMDWPQYDSRFLVYDSIEIPVQINGKVRARVTVNADVSEEELKKIVLNDENVKKYLTSEPKKVVVVPKKLVSIVL